MHTHEGLGRYVYSWRENWVREFQPRIGANRQSPNFSGIKLEKVDIIIWSSTWVGRWIPAELKDMYQIAMYTPEEELEFCLLQNCCFCSFTLFLHSSLPLKPLITETHSRAVIVAKLRSQNGLYLRWLLLCPKENHALVLFKDPRPLSIYRVLSPSVTLSWSQTRLRILLMDVIGCHA